MAERHRRTRYEVTPIEATAHQGDTRPNIPTAELASFALAEEQAPYTLRYPRDPSLDPQLVWKGKDQQDGQDLEVPALPIYIQEHIAPKAIIDDLLREQAEGGPRQASLFETFDGMDFSQRVDFYQHQQAWTNRMILGDSLLVMTSLAEKEGLKGKVQMIYMDPPYGIKFGSNWQVSTRKRDVRDGRAEDAAREPEVIRAFRDTWQLGIHSYLAYWRDRLVAAYELLIESGSVFVQIGDENVHLVRCLLDEVFGSDNFVGQIAFMTTTGRGSDYLDNVYDTLVWYAKDLGQTKYRQVFSLRTAEMLDERYRHLEGERRFRLSGLTSQGQTQSQTSQPFEFQGQEYRPSAGRHWSTGHTGLRRLVLANRIGVEGKALVYKRYDDDFPLFPIRNIWADTGGGALVSEKVYVVQTASKVIERCLQMTSDPGDLVLDPTCGSGTTAYVAEQWGRRWITIDTSRVAIALARTRLMAARFPYYLLADSPEGIRKEAEVAGWPVPVSLPATQGDVHRGFVYKRVPHVTLESIANNPDINEGMTREEIDAAIARHADQEYLYDQPYEDRKIVRVTGPFTVESLSPHRVLSEADDQRPSSEQAAVVSNPGQFEATILDNLRKAGVKTTLKEERLRFDRLEFLSGRYLQCEGVYTENGQEKKVAVCIGPEHGTVGPDLLREAAKEAVKGVGFDLLVVCGFWFDPHVAEETKEYGRLQVVPVRIHNDLQFGEEHLKRTGAGDLFLAFGEPDIDVRHEPDGKLRVEIRGVDVYDPTTGQVRSHQTDDIACWFIDTDYNEECFFVRHAYFCGADEPYDRLKRALKADIDEAAWSELYSTVSRPFDPPSTGKIAVKVFNHYGDEVLKMYAIAQT